MLRILLILLLAPCAAPAAGLDITADELSQEAGVVIASGNVIIRQYPARTIRHLRIVRNVPGKAVADFELDVDPDGETQHRRLYLSYDQGRWEIIRDISGNQHAAGATVRAPALEEFIRTWRHAWNRRDLHAYIAHYAVHAFPDRHASRKAWLTSLRQRFTQVPERSIRADRIRIDRNRHRIRAEGHVRIHSPEGKIEAASAELDSRTRTGFIEQATLYLPGGERLQATRLTRISGTLFEAEDARFTACPADDEAWTVRARNARLDQQAGEFSARHMRLELAGLPVLYAPWWSEPLRRHSGLLSPLLGSSGRRGTELGLPLYLAPAASWDMTLTPTWMSKRGVQGQLELRHVSNKGRETVHVEGIRDRLTGTTRSRLGGDVQWHLPLGMDLNIHGDHVSDYQYLADYAGGQEASLRYLQSSATLSRAYLSDTLIADWLLTEQYQQDMTQTSNTATLQIQPRLESRLSWRVLSGAYLHLDQQTTRFSRRIGTDGWRMDLHPYLEIPWQLDGGGASATLSIGGHHTRYWLQDIQGPSQQRRSSREASLEIRSDFERIDTARSWRHQFSPILRYDYIGVSDQAGLINFDSSFGRLTWGNLLEGNRFSGLDRIERVNRISAMLENTLQIREGEGSREIAKIRLGAAYDMLRASVDPALQAAPIRPFSNLLAEASLAPYRGLRIFASGQYQTIDHYWATLNSSLSAHIGEMNLYAGYQSTDARYARELQLIRLGGDLRLSNRWRLNADWQYDNLLRLTQQTTLGLKYIHPCWSLGLEGYRLNRPSGTAQASDTGFRILLEFKGLGSVGSS